MFTDGKSSSRGTVAESSSMITYGKSSSKRTVA